jgi:rubrerythrin
MANPKTAFIGSYIPRDLKDELQARAKALNRSVSQEVGRILHEVVTGRLLLTEGKALLRCERCLHQWTPRKKGSAPKFCPRCKSPYWSLKRKRLTGGRPKTTL